MSPNNQALLVTLPPPNTEAHRCCASCARNLHRKRAAATANCRQLPFTHGLQHRRICTAGKLSAVPPQFTCTVNLRAAESCTRQPGDRIRQSAYACDEAGWQWQLADASGWCQPASDRAVRRLGRCWRRDNPRDRYCAAAVNRVPCTVQARYSESNSRPIATAFILHLSTADTAGSWKLHLPHQFALQVSCITSAGRSFMLRPIDNDSCCRFGKCTSRLTLLHRLASARAVGVRLQWS